jgi:hypothetical protein
LFPPFRRAVCPRRESEIWIAGRCPGEAGLIIAQLIVDGAPDPADNKAWGRFSFVALPRPGERIEVAHDGFIERLLIESVQHRPVPHPPGESRTLRGLEAQALVFARWVRK